MIQTPDRKVTVGALVAACGVVAVFAFEAITQLKVPADVALAVNTIVIAVVQYAVANK